MSISRRGSSILCEVPQVSCSRRLVRSAGFFGQDSEHDLRGLETSALPRNAVDSGFLEVVPERAIELKTRSWRQCFGASALLDTAGDQSRVAEFLAVEDDVGLQDLRVDHLVTIVDQCELNSQVFCLTR